MVTRRRQTSDATRTRIRRQVYELTASDLQRHPVWEYAVDEEGRKGQDEATVRPYKVRGTLDPAGGMFIVRAWLTLADGTRVRGSLTPPFDGDTWLAYIQPQAVTPDGQVSFWCGILAPKRRDISARYARLGKSSARQVFPLRFESDVPLKTGPVHGEVPGFMVLENFRTRKTRVLK